MTIPFSITIRIHFDKNIKAIVGFAPTYTGFADLRQTT